MFKFQFIRKKGLPDLICEQCILMTAQSYRFIKQVKNNDALSSNIAEIHIDDSELVDIVNKQNISMIEKCSQDKSESEKLDPGEHLQIFSDLIRKPYKCILCNKEYFEQRLNESHMQGENNNFQCDECQDTSLTINVFSKGNELIHETDTDSDLECRFCGKTFLKLRYKLGHELRHTQKGHLVCVICNNNFFSKNELDRHIAGHTLEKKFVCQYNNCAKKFKTQSELNRHCLYHSGEKKFECHRCNKKFTESIHCRNHIKFVHLKIREFHCEYCNESFATNKKLIRHSQSKKCFNNKEEKLTASNIPDENTTTLTFCYTDSCFSNTFESNEKATLEPNYNEENYIEDFVVVNRAQGNLRYRDLITPLLDEVTNDYTQEFRTINATQTENFMNIDNIPLLLPEMNAGYLPDHQINSMENNYQMVNSYY